VISLPFCLLRQAWIWTRVLTSLTGSAPLPSLVPVPHQVPLYIWGLHLILLRGRVPPLDQAVCWLLMVSSPGGPGMHILATREVTNHQLHNPRPAPKKCCGNLKLRYRTLRQFSRKQHFILPADSADSCPKAEPWEQKGLTLCTLVSRLQKQKARFNPYVIVGNSIGYFSPSATWPFLCFSSLSFISLLCHPFPLLHYQNTNLSVCLFLVLLPTTLALKMYSILSLSIVTLLCNSILELLTPA
jgi:hypothetical protein